MKPTKKDLLIIPVAIVVMIAWLASLGVAMLRSEYTALSITTPVMLLLSGYVFGITIVRQAPGGKKPDDQ